MESREPQPQLKLLPHPAAAGRGGRGGKGRQPSPANLPKAGEVITNPSSSVSPDLRALPKSRDRTATCARQVQKPGFLLTLLLPSSRPRRQRVSPLPGSAWQPGWGPGQTQHRDPGPEEGAEPTGSCGRALQMEPWPGHPDSARGQQSASPSCRFPLSLMLIYLLLSIVLQSYPYKKARSGFAIFFFVQNVDEMVNQTFARGHPHSTEPTPAHGCSATAALTPEKLLGSAGSRPPSETLAAL